MQLHRGRVARDAALGGLLLLTVCEPVGLLTPDNFSDIHHHGLYSGHGAQRREPVRRARDLVLHLPSRFSRRGPVPRSTRMPQLNTESTVRWYSISI